MIKRKQPIILIAVLIAILVLEILPYGAVLHFANPEGEPFRETFSYFDLTPYGYSMIGGAISILLLAVFIISLTKKMWA